MKDLKLNGNKLDWLNGDLAQVEGLELIKQHILTGLYTLKGDWLLDYTVGIVLSKKVGDYVVENEELAKVYLNKVDLGINEILDCFEITDMVGELSPLIKEIVR